MLKDFIEINNCKHYFANKLTDGTMFLIDYRYALEKDVNVKHPFGAVYKAKGVIDTPVRFVQQPNKTILYFNLYEWNNFQNQFAQNREEMIADFILNDFISKLKSIFKIGKKPLVEHTPKLPMAYLSYWQKTA